MVSIKDFNFKNIRALVRVDFNVPMDADNNILDDSRIQAAAPTIKKILKDGGAAILMTHLGRPKEKLQSVKFGAEKKFSTEHLKVYLEKEFNAKVHFVDDCASEEAYKVASSLKGNEILLLENTRFYTEETEGEEEFAHLLSTLGDVYVNDAFGTAHRAHASTAIVAQSFTPDRKMYGFLMNDEIENADIVLKNPEKPVLAIIGGAKVSDKILIIENLMNIADDIIIGGGMAYTFFKAQGGNIGNSLCEEDKLELALDIIKKAKENNVTLHLPSDSIIADKFDKHANTMSSKSDKIPDGWMGLDIGDDAINEFENVILNAKTILWNGPMGVFEMEKFQNGTKSVAEAIAKTTINNNTFSLIGGGDSVSAIKMFNLQDSVSYISTGGGAMLEYFEGKKLPGIEAVK